MVGYIQGKDMYIKTTPDDDEDYDRYYITIDGTAYIEGETARRLAIPLDDYLNILKSCGVIKNGNGYLCFANEDDAIKAAVMLNLIV